MLRRISLFVSFLFLVFLAGGLVNADPAVTPALEAYVNGLDAMSNAQWKAAIAAFDKAVQLDSENPTYYTARGVAKTLSEDFPAGEKDLDRSLRLRPNDKETKMWRAVAERLSNWYAMVDTGILYGDDCPREYSIFIFDNLVISYHKPGVDKGTDEKSRVDFPRAGKWFADLAFSRPGVVPALYKRAKQQTEAKQGESALETAERLLALTPEDSDALRVQAFARLDYGDAATARVSFTRVLTALTTDGESYAGRAMARARMGDIKGANEDYQLAKKFGAKQHLAEAEKFIAQATSEAPSSSRADAVKAFREAIDSGANWDELVAKGLTVRKIMNGERRRWDQTYQSRMRTLEAAAKAKPNDSDRQIDVAEFLYDQSGVRGEEVEPRSGWRGYRYQTDETKEAEIQRAEGIVNGVLDKNPNNLRALGLKVRLRLYYQQNADAEQFYKKMLSLEASDPNSMVIYAEMIDAMAWQKSYEAGNLRAQNGSVTYSGDWMTTTYLTDEGWRQVYEKEAMAREFSQLASRTLEKAAKAMKGTPRGDYYQAKVYLRDGKNAEARASLEQAVKGDPEYMEAYDMLASVYGRLGDQTKAFQTRVTAWNKAETSVGLILPVARQDIVGTRFKTARESLDWALTIDPADSRIYSYYGVSLAGDEKNEDALKWFRGALAMEEARAKQQGTTYLPGVKDIRTVEDFGLSMAVRQRMTEMMKEMNKPPAERLLLARANTAIDQRITMNDWSKPVYSAMIPSLNEEVNGPPPQVPEGIERIAWARIAAGSALYDAGDYKGADAEYKMVYTYGKQFKDFVVDRADNNGLRDATHYAALGWGFVNLKLDNYDGAVWCLQQLPARRMMGDPSQLDKDTAELAAAVKQYKDAHGILTDQEKQIKDIDDMNAANRKMVQDELDRRNQQNQQFEQQRQQQMDDYRKQQQAVDEQRRKQIEDMQKQQKRRTR